MPRPPFLADLLDHIVDDLQDETDVLKNCCLVSRSWVPRTRKHLFMRVILLTQAKLQSWKTTFPDSSTSPACYVKYLFIRWPQIVEATSAENGGWVSTFSSVVYLLLDTSRTGDDWEAAITLTPLYGFSPVLKYLTVVLVALPPSQFSNLINSFPLLEGITVNTIASVSTNNDEDFIQPSGSPALTGSLQLSMRGGMDAVVSQLLRLSNGPQFRELDLTWKSEKDVPLTTVLVEKCSSTLESLNVTATILGTLVRYLSHTGNLPSFADPLQSEYIDLDKATNLQEVMFTCTLAPRWISATLRTVKHNHKKLQRVTVRLKPSPALDSIDVKRAIGVSGCQEWLELDRILANLWESHSIILSIQYTVDAEEGDGRAKNQLRRLLPESTRRTAGLIERKDR